MVIGRHVPGCGRDMAGRLGATAETWHEVQAW
jgi:hypothetical protein